MRTLDRLAQSYRSASASEASAAPRCCEWPECTAAGEYRAPRSRDQINAYRWFCLEHVRQYNAGWNYYAGMSDDEVEADLRFDTVWQRRTWPLGTSLPGYAWRMQRMADAAAGVFEEGAARPPTRREPSTPEGRAMATLDLSAPVTVAEVKARYKQLVKKHHPDANGGDKSAEERFKQISEAYRIVMNHLAR